MGMFGSLSMATGFAIVMGSLVALAFIAGFIKLYFNKRRLAKHVKLDELKAKGMNDDREMLNTRQLDEGDLFGVRALEGGYFGGVAQSRPSSPTPSYVLSSQTSLTSWGEQGDKSSNASPSNSTTDLGGNGLGVSTGKKHKPSPLRLGNVEKENRATGPPRRKSPDGNSIDAGDQKRGWASPPDVQFAKKPKPTSPTSTTPTTRPRSYLPRLGFPEGSANQGVSGGPQSEVGSIIGSEISQYTSRTIDRVAEARSPTTRSPDSPSGSIYHQYIPSRGGRETSRSIFPAQSPRDHSSSRGIKDGRQPKTPTSPITYIPSAPKITSTKPVSDDNVKKMVEELTSKVQVHQLRQTIAAPKSESTVQVTEQTRSRSTSTSTTRSSKSFSQVRDSIRRPSLTHLRATSSERNNRYSRDRDQIHYDPTPKSRLRSGSVQGRAVDFDHPRESPFSNAHAAAPSISHSAKTSTSSLSSYESAPQRQSSKGRGGFQSRVPSSSPSRGHGLQVAGMQDPDRLSVMSKGRGRSASDSSQASISDFYDSYYRQSTMSSQRFSSFQTRRDSANLVDKTSNPQGIRSYSPERLPPLPRRSSDRVKRGGEEGEERKEIMINPGFNFTLGRKGPPPPLNMRPAQVGDTIIEMPSPSPGLISPVRGGGKDFERFPSRI